MRNNTDPGAKYRNIHNFHTCIEMFNKSRNLSFNFVPCLTIVKWRRIKTVDMLAGVFALPSRYWLNTLQSLGRCTVPLAKSYNTVERTNLGYTE